jgi:hypothetical protein
MNIALAEAAGISVIIASIFLSSLTALVFNAYAQQGGAATGGDATVGGPNCNVAYACPITQGPRGGDATGGAAEATPQPRPEAPGQESSTILHSPSFSEDNITTASSSDGYLSYENSTFGFRLSYPSNWYATDGYPLDNTVHFYPPQQNLPNTYDGDFAVTIEKILSLSQHPTEGELLNKIINSYAVNPDFILINSSAKTTLAGNPAYQLILTYSNPSYGKLLVMEVGAIFNETLYRLTYSVNPSNYHLDLPTVQRMIDSFDIFDTSSIAS